MIFFSPSSKPFASTGLFFFSFLLPPFSLFYIVCQYLISSFFWFSLGYRYICFYGCFDLFLTVLFVYFILGVVKFYFFFFFWVQNTFLQPSLLKCRALVLPFSLRIHPPNGPFKLGTSSNFIIIIIFSIAISCPLTDLIALP